MMPWRDKADEEDACKFLRALSSYRSGRDNQPVCWYAHQCDSKNPRHATTYYHPTAGQMAQLQVRASFKPQRLWEAEETVVVSERRDPTWTERVPRAFVHPFMRGHDYDAVFHPKTVVELALMKLSADIRSEPDWEHKRWDPLNVQRWREAARVQRVGEAGVEYVMAELEYYRSLRDGPIEPSSVDGVWQADALIPPELRRALMDGVGVLENDVQEAQKDSQSDRCVRDVLDPSLCPLIYDVSRFVPSANYYSSDSSSSSSPSLNSWTDPLNGGKIARFPKGEESKDSPDVGVSRRYQFLPSEFAVSLDGAVSIRSYINNLHPTDHAPLYATIASIFERLVPLFARTLTDLLHGRPDRVHCDYDDTWLRPAGRPRPRQPEVPPFVAPPRRDRDLVDLRGRSCQVIVKLSNIVLSPEHPKYKGGREGHVEGILNEHIVAVGVYYYDATNISESLLHFRQTVDGGAYSQWDPVSFRAIFGLREGRVLNQFLGAVQTKSDRCIVFPNALRRRVAPFHLLDPSRGGALRSLVFLLVDPAVRIPSTADVPPQQRAWLEREMLSSEGALRCLPEVLVREVMAYVGDGITPQEARTHREKLVGERRAIGRELSSRKAFQRPYYY